jgi:phosphohistidine phosphatase
MIQPDATYNGSADTLRRHVEDTADEAGCLIVVAHNPGVHQLAVEYLIEGAASPSIVDRMTGGFPPGAAAIFSVDVAERLTFEGFLQPADLTAE